MQSYSRSQLHPSTRYVAPGCEQAIKQIEAKISVFSSHHAGGCSQRKHRGAWIRHLLRLLLIRLSNYPGVLLCRRESTPSGGGSMLHWINCVWGWNMAVIRQLSVYQRPVSLGRLSESQPMSVPKASPERSHGRLREWALIA